MFQLTCPGRQCVKNDVLSGLTVALALVPEAVAFAFVAGVDLLVGLYGAFLMGLITALLGGRPGMISGATGALQVAAGVLRLGKFIRLVPYPVIWSSNFGQVHGLGRYAALASTETGGR